MASRRASGMQSWQALSSCSRAARLATSWSRKATASRYSAPSRSNAWAKPIATSKPEMLPALCAAVNRFCTSAFARSTSAASMSAACAALSASRSASRLLPCTASQSRSATVILVVSRCNRFSASSKSVLTSPHSLAVDTAAERAAMVLISSASSTFLRAECLVRSLSVPAKMWTFSEESKPMAPSPSSLRSPSKQGRRVWSNFSMAHPNGSSFVNQSLSNTLKINVSPSTKPVISATWFQMGSKLFSMTRVLNLVLGLPRTSHVQ
mmetsp:Transcript_50903/g.128418  ORF Transcript_50903/g.128418 Transcript_50903/m.128418 type:complete len:266 (-) Transcript_50903:491-1288(-)